MIEVKQIIFTHSKLAAAIGRNIMEEAMPAKTPLILARSIEVNPRRPRPDHGPGLLLDPGQLSECQRDALLRVGLMG
jgi:hypothetical protein